MLTFSPTHPVSQRELVAASLIARPETAAPKATTNPVFAWSRP